MLNLYIIQADNADMLTTREIGRFHSATGAKLIARVIANAQVYSEPVPTDGPKPMVSIDVWEPHNGEPLGHLVETQFYNADGTSHTERY